MQAYANEREQLDAIKGWWKSNGKMTVAIILIGLACSFGWHFWQQHQLQRSEQASMLFDQLLNSFAGQQTDQFNQVANQLQNKYAGTPYAAVSALLEARQAVNQNKLDIADQKLQWVIDHSKDNNMREIARVRKARILLAQKQYAEALAILEKADDKAYTTMVDEVKGDVYLAWGKKPEARQAYLSALAAMPATEPMRPYLQMKVDQLGSL